MTEADPCPDGLPEDLYVDIESTIHQHCGHDGQSDEANDWVTDLMSAISPLIVRALVGGRSAAPTREQDDERPDDSVRRTSLGAQRLVAAIDAHVAKTHEPLAAGKDPAVAAQLFSEDSIELLLKAREVVALLSRSAAEPPPDGVLAADLVEQGWRIVKLSHARTHGLVDHDIVVEEWDEADAGVAAEPNEEHDDG